MNRNRARSLAAAALVLVSGCTSSPTTVPSTLVYTALGASDAVGIGAFPPTLGYVCLIAERLRGARPKVEFHNLGINGAKADEFIAQELPDAVASNPDIVTLWTGENDLIAGRTPDQFAAHLDEILRRLRSETHAQVFVADLVDISRAPLFRNFPDPDVTSARVAAFNQRIYAGVAAHGAVLVKISAQSIDDSLFSIDGFHPSNKGHELLAQGFWAEIEPRLP